ncbi:pseudouridine synthase TruD/Pus7 [Paecilomyces variotii No. 5]|uniref:Pseudouridine synthase TruD/Pus7 n=1 Tax=Byssochlamys spectabilis (strain No. 5 / NBRC 109023) TaxID=1356009 RepID=V5FQI6_BYSSN|nr:pseudouridine synthase TruD/Pus7 [Paecilomyces variotii No. 5]
MDREEIIESPRKRLKTDDASQSDVTVPLTSTSQTQSGETPVLLNEDVQALKEAEVGITEFVSSNTQGFSGILKKRYTDFLVNEILPTGEVLHLRDLVAPSSMVKQESKDDAADNGAVATTEDSAPTTTAVETTQTEEKPADTGSSDVAVEFQISEEDNALLKSFFGDDITQQILNLNKRALSDLKARPSDLGKVKSGTIDDRDLRTKIHQAIRRIFDSKLESATDSDGTMAISASPNRNKRNKQGGRGGQGGGGRGQGRLSWDELGGPYLHFTIYKENKDTMEVISYLARQLRANPKSFQFAGTKDRRGVTVQRACAYRVYAERLVGVSRSLRNAVLGDYEYRKHGLELGDLGGNEFVITLRECEFTGIDPKDPDAVASASRIVEKSLKDLRDRGYFNYYGLQRFGTFSTRTDTVGVKMLQGDFKGACDAIFHFSPHVLAAAQNPDDSSPVSNDDKARAEAIHIFQTTGRVNDALDKLPRKFSAEANLIRHLGRSKNDYLGALGTIPRNLRLMYVHAYQSLVWNFAAGERWRLYGDKVVEGDLVLINEHKDKQPTKESETVDADGEIIVVPQGEDAAATADDVFTRARALTAEEATSGKYSIFDVVLPQPGFDILYPTNEMTDFYKRFMASEQGGGLDPFDMRRKWKDISLSGSYRKVLSRPGADYSFEVKSYSKDDQQFIQTDLERLKSASEEIVPETSVEPGDKLAVILKFQLGASQYATMALRELMKTGGVKTYKPDFGGGR